MTGILIKGGACRQTHTVRMSCEDEGGDLGDASINQETPKVSSKPPEAREEVWNGFSLPSGGTNLADTLILDF